MKILEYIREAWYLLAAIFAGGGGVFAWFQQQKKKEADSSEMLYNQLEALKKKVILQVAKEVNYATEVAEKDRIIEGLRLHCPDCYATYLETIAGNDNKG